MSVFRIEPGCLYVREAAEDGEQTFVFQRRGEPDRLRGIAQIFDGKSSPYFGSFTEEVAASIMRTGGRVSIVYKLAEDVDLERLVGRWDPRASCTFAAWLLEVREFEGLDAREKSRLAEAVRTHTS